jgi:hypothetical protein
MLEIYDQNVAEVLTNKQAEWKDKGTFHVKIRFLFLSLL